MCTSTTNNHQNVSQVSGGTQQHASTLRLQPRNAANKQKGSFSLAVPLLMNLWCTVVKPYEMSPRAVPSSLKWPFRIYQAGYGGYPDASTTCWAARRHVTEDVAHISEATGDLSYKSHTHIRPHEHTHRHQRWKLHEHIHFRDRGQWAGHPSHTNTHFRVQSEKLSLSHTAKFKYIANTSETMTGHLNALTHTLSEDLKNLYPDTQLHMILTL